MVNLKEKYLKRVIEDIPVKSLGTYNIADPTHFEKGEKCVIYKEEKFYIKFIDCTWVTDLCLYKGTKRLGKWSINMDGHLISEETKKGAFNLLMQKLCPNIFHPFFISQQQQQWELEANNDFEDYPYYE